MKVQDVMTVPAYSCRVGDTLNRVAELMWEHAIGLLPVLDADGRPVAVITDRDVAMATFLTGRRLSEIPVAQSMSRGLHVARIDEGLDEVQLRMAEAKVRRLPVLNEDDALEGIVSVDDLIRAAAAGWRLLEAPMLLEALGQIAHTPIERQIAEAQEEAAAEVALEAAGDAVRAGFQQAASDLKARRDALQLQMHLAGMEARTEWEQLEERWQGLQSTIVRAERKAEADIQRTISDIGEGYRQLRDAILGRGNEE
ncbi:MAG: CBS domain-containing protein [Myxococcota bacterium]